MESKPVKSTNPKPDTVISLQQKITRLQIQIVRFQQKILKLESIKFKQEQKILKLQMEIERLKKEKQPVSVIIKGFDRHDEPPEK